MSDSDRTVYYSCFLHVFSSHITRDTESYYYSLIYMQNRSGGTRPARIHSGPPRPTLDVARRHTIRTRKPEGENRYTDSRAESIRAFAVA